MRSEAEVRQRLVEIEKTGGTIKRWLKEAEGLDGEAYRQALEALTAVPVWPMVMMTWCRNCFRWVLDEPGGDALGSPMDLVENFRQRFGE